MHNAACVMWLCKHISENSDWIHFGKMVYIPLNDPDFHQIPENRQYAYSNGKKWKKMKKKISLIWRLTCDAVCLLIQCLNCFLLLATVTMVLLTLQLLLLVGVVLSPSPSKQFSIENEHLAEMTGIFRVLNTKKKITQTISFTPHTHIEEDTSIKD